MQSQAENICDGPASLEAGHRLGPYQVLAPGKGGMGEVYKARDTRSKRDVAIKIYAAHYLVSPHDVYPVQAAVAVPSTEGPKWQKSPFEQKPAARLLGPSPCGST